MAILERPRIIAQQRYDLDDFNALLSSLRTDDNYYTKRFLSGENYILKGFTVSGIGLTSATINMPDSTLIFPQNTSDFSWFSSESGASNIVIPDADLTNNTRNYIELRLYTENNTPLTKAFWDETANSGSGAEFNQVTDTMTTIRVGATVLLGGFSGNPDRIPIAIVDTDPSGNIKVIIDKRNLFFRLGTNSDPSNTFSWVTKEEPLLNVVLSGGSGTYTAGETVTFTSGATGIVATGGTTSITVRELSNDSVATGDTLVGSSSGASRTVDTILHSYTGGDSDIDDFKEFMNAIMTEIKNLKGTSFWYQNPLTSLVGLGRFVNSVIAPNSSNARFSWSGTQLSITDDNVSPTDSDVIGYIRVFGASQVLDITRQDGTGASTPISIADGEVLFVEVPASGNVSYSGSGSAASNFQVVPRASFVINDTNFWIGYREGSNLILRGMGEMEAGEDRQISDNTTQEVLSFIGAASEVDTTPPYPFTPNGLCPESFTSANSLTDAIGANAENINEIYNTLDEPSYDEILTVVSGIPADDNEITGPVVSSTIINMPLHSRSTPPDQTQYYTVGKGGLEIYLNGQFLSLGTNGWSEVGASGSDSTQIQINQDLEVGDVLEFRIDAAGAPGAGGGGTAPDDNFITLTEESSADNADFVLIYDDSASAYRKMTRANFLAGLSSLEQVNSYSSDHNASVSSDDVLVVNATSGNVTITLPAVGTANGKKFNIKKIDASGFSVIIDGNGALIDGSGSISTTTQYESFTVVCDGTQWWII